MKTTHLRNLALAASALAAATLAACGGGGSSGTTAVTPAPVATLGTVTFGITDAPACGFDAVNITVNKLRIHQSAAAGETDAGWTDVTLNPARKINLLNLTNGVLESLGQTDLTPGHYAQLRLVLDANAGTGLANSVVETGSTTQLSLDTPSAVQSGIKLVGEFDVVAGQKTDLVLDFDACKSVVPRGKNGYALKPVVKFVPSVANGITGFVAPTLTGVTVSAQQNGKIVSATTPTSTGAFSLSRLPTGNYDVVITADGRATAVITAVPVASTTATVALSTQAAPITPAASTATGTVAGTVTLTPASTTEAAYVAAKQTFGSGPTVTVKYKGADITTGAYTLAGLPVSAPLVAAYSATLPLVFSAQTTVTVGAAAKYTIEAAATGYAAKSGAADVTAAATTTVNFTLTP
jgi:hypothetical protein